MKTDLSAATTKPRGHSIVIILAAFPIACFTCALLTDIAYVQTTRMMWADFSDWLLLIGMVGGVIAAFAGLVSLLLNRRREASRAVWPLVIGSLLVLIVAFFNNLVHSRDAWTSVMPTGLILSGVTVLLMLVTAGMSARVSGPQIGAMPYGGLSQ